MRKSIIVAVFCLGSVALCAAPQKQPDNSFKVAPQALYRAVLDEYCVTCHSDQLKTAGLSLEKLDLARVSENAEIWEKVIRKVRVGMMPPPDAPHPDDGTRRALVSWLETTLDRAAAAKPNPGRPLAHRLNRAEYSNAIRDLLALEVDSASLLPPDDAAYGFDNIADVLGASPVLLERYLSAAGAIASLAVGDPETGPASQVFRIRQDASQDVHIEGLPIGTVGGLLAVVTLPLDGEYVLQTKLFRTNLGAMRGLEYSNQLEITVDSERVHLASFGGDADFKAALQNITAAADAVEARFAARIPLKARPHAIGAAFLGKSEAENSLRLQPFIRSSAPTTRWILAAISTSIPSPSPGHSTPPGQAIRPAAGRFSSAARRQPRKNLARAGFCPCWSIALIAEPILQPTSSASCLSIARAFKREVSRPASRPRLSACSRARSS
jgi:mono/diheme cytochrome c family protein